MAPLAVLLPVLIAAVGLSLWWTGYRVGGGGREGLGLVIVVGGTMLVASFPLVVWFAVKGGT